MKQPYAELLISGKKTIELRNWRPIMRGPLLIHSSQMPTALSDFRILLEDCARVELDYLKLDYGSIIGSVKIADIKRYSSKEQMLQDSFSHYASPDYFTEEAYRVGRANGWIIREPRRFVKPISGVKGALSIWEYVSPSCLPLFESKERLES